MTLPMIIALAVTVLMIILIMVDKLPFGAPPLLALLLLVVFGVTDIKTAFGGFANPTIVMLASFMAIIAALQKTSFIVKFKQTMFNMASKGGFKAYVLLILIVMLGCSLFGTGSTAYYVLVIGLLSTLPYSKQLPPSKVLMPAGFAANHPLLPFNTALQYGIVIAVLESAGVAANVNLVKFSLVNLCLSIGFLVWCVLAYKILPDHPIAEAKEEALHAGEQKVALTKNQELITYFSFVLAVVGMILQSKIGDAGYAITGLAVGIILISGVMDFNEIRNSISAPIILMSAGVIGIADALGNTGLTSLVGETVAKMLGTNVNPFVLIFAFSNLTSLLATLTGSTNGTVYVFAGGKVTEIKPPAEEEKEDPAAAALKAENENLKAQLTEAQTKATEAQDAVKAVKDDLEAFKAQVTSDIKGFKPEPPKGGEGGETVRKPFKTRE